MGQTRVLIVDDSIFFRKFLTDNLSAYPDIDVIGYAVNALEAKYAIADLRPDVVTLDVEMPGMSGPDLLKNMMVNSPVPVIMVSAVNMTVFDALSAGAIDFVKKPDATDPDAGEKFIQELAGKIEVAKSAHPHLRASAAPESVSSPNLSAAVSNLSSISGAAAVTAAAASSAGSAPNNLSKVSFIALGASTGGTEATLVVLKELPKSTPGIVIVQHMPPVFTKMYAERLNSLCQMEVREAKNGDRIEQGLVLIAPGDMHMQVVRAGTYYTVKCFYGEKVSGHCPSVDVLFNSVAEVAGKDVIGIILTGMGKDGADGLLKMRQKGAYTIGQDQESCVVYGMPMVAFNIGAVAQQASCENIPLVLRAHLPKF